MNAHLNSTQLIIINSKILLWYLLVSINPIDIYINENSNLNLDVQYPVVRFVYIHGFQSLLRALPFLNSKWY